MQYYMFFLFFLVCSVYTQVGLNLRRSMIFHLLQSLENFFDCKNGGLPTTTKMVASQQQQKYPIQRIVVSTKQDYFHSNYF